MDNSGHIHLHRKILEWGWYGDINTCRLFIHMLLKANWKEGKFREITVPRGSFISSIEKLSEETALTKKEVRTAIEHLKRTGEVASKTTNRYSVFSIKNYDMYQDNGTQNGNQTADNGQSNGILMATIEEDNKGIKKENINNITNRNIICPEPENPASVPPVISLPLNDKSLHGICQTDVDGWAELYPAVDIMQELRKMKGWLDTNPTKRKTKRGIGRFINGWLSRAQDSGKNNKAGG